MNDSRRTKAELMEEIERLRARVPELERELEHCKRAEDALRESEERFRTLFENAPIGRYRTTPDGRILDANPALVRMLGYSSFEELATRNLEVEGFEPEYPRREFIERIEREGAIVGMEAAWKKRGGTVVFVRENARAIRDADGRITHYEGTVEDITDRKRAEARLRESEKRFRDIAENAFGWIWEVDTDGRYTYASPVVREILGYEPEEMLKKRFYDFFHPEDREEMKKAAFEVFAARQSFRDFINRNVHKNGKTVWLSTSGVPVLDERGNLVGYRGADTDITERKEAEEALWESEARYRSLFDHVPVGLYRSTPAGRIVAANLALVRMLGFPDCDSLLKRNVRSLYVESSDRQRLLQEISHNGVALDLEFQLRRYDGTPIWVKENARTVRDSSGAVLCYEGSLEDITERKLAVEELRQAHDDLERRVEERTADLTAVNRRLQREISERIQAEEALRESERKCRAIFDQTFQFVGLMTPDGTLIEANKTALDFAGIQESDALGKPFWETPWWKHSIELQDRLRDAVNKAAAGHFIRFEATHPAADGSLHHVDFSLKPVKDEAGNVSLLIPEGRDITERKRAEEQLKLFLHCVESSADGIAMGSLDGRITYVNETFAGMLGYSKEELTGKEIAFVYAEDQIAKLKEALKVTTKSGWTGELVARRKNGELFPMSVASSRVLDDEGKMIAHMASHQDITNRKRAEEALRESEERLRTVVGASKDAMIAIDEKGLMTLFNPAAERMFGRSARAMLGQPLDCLMPEEYRERHREYIEGYFARGEPRGAIGRTVELSAVRSDGHEFPVGLSLSIGRRGDQRFALAVIRDISEVKRAEKELRRAKEAAETANQAKGRFLANMSHEIRTPITAMLGAAELLAVADCEHADYRHRSDIILRNGRHLLSLVDDLLDLSRVEAGKQEIQRTRCSLLDILADVRAVTEPLHHDEKVDFRILCEGAIPTHIHTDPTRLKQAVINLINNALKSTDAGHVYTRVSVNRADAEPRLTIAVEDTGVGISAKDIERIFDTFTQVDPAPSRIRIGVGLGLPLAKWIAQQLGGTLEVTSAKGRGSTFTLRVAAGPLEDVDWVTPSEAVSPRPSSTVREHVAARVRLRGNILLAEDFRDVRDLISHRLIRAGAEVKAVHNGEEAVRAAVERDFDLILLDVRMPGMDGPAAAAELRRRGCLTPIIALTAATADNDRERIIAAGFDELWPKPMSLERLVERVADYVRADRDDIQNDAAAATPRSTRVTGDPRMASVVAEFSRNLPARLQKLRDLVDAGDLRQAREVLHQLVGVAGILGYMSLSDEAARVLAMIKDGSFSGADNLRPLEDLVNEIARGLRNDQSVPGGDVP